MCNILRATKSKAEKMGSELERSDSTTMKLPSRKKYLKFETEFMAVGFVVGNSR